MASHNNRNPGTPLDLDWVYDARVNRSAVERRTKTLPGRRSIKKDWQAAWLLRAVTCLDLTTLAGDDTPGRVKRLCAKARQPVRPDMLAALDVADQNITVGAVCVRSRGDRGGQRAHVCPQERRLDLVLGEQRPRPVGRRKPH